MTVFPILIASSLLAAAIDVTSLGAKNDGSADVSAIVNAATGKGTLYFPPGRYRVERPLVLKNPIRGEGYSRSTFRTNDVRTWLVSALAATNAEASVIAFGENARINIEEINIECEGPESAIRIEPCRQSTSVFVSRVGIFSLGGFGVYVNGGASRPVFMQDVTVFGRRHAYGSVGISLRGICDCRVSNVEIMGTRIGMQVFNGHTYGDNLHLWTGCMGGKDDGNWWHGTRGLVLGPGAHFSGSQIYPDTSFYAIEQIGDGGLCEISNVMYWEDDSIKIAANHGGEFYHTDANADSRLVLQGGLIGVGGTDGSPGWMANMYNPRIIARDVGLKSRYAICAANMNRLCLGGDLPDYTVRYDEKGWCRVADVFAVAPTGCCEADFTLDDGAAWKISVVRDAKGLPKVTFDPQNALCEGRGLKSVNADGGKTARIYFHNPKPMPFKARFTTRRMGDRFRPVDYGALRDYGGKSRYREVLEEIDDFSNKTTTKGKTN